MYQVLAKVKAFTSRTYFVTMNIQTSSITFKERNITKMTMAIDEQ